MKSLQKQFTKIKHFMVPRYLLLTKTTAFSNQCQLGMYKICRWRLLEIIYQALCDVMCAVFSLYLHTYFKQKGNRY